MFVQYGKTETKARSASILQRVLNTVVGEGMKILWGMFDACIPLEPIALGHVRNYGSTIAPSFRMKRALFEGVYEAVGGKLSIRFSQANRAVLAEKKVWGIVSSWAAMLSLN